MSTDTFLAGAVPRTSFTAPTHMVSTATRLNRVPLLAKMTWMAR